MKRCSKCKIIKPLNEFPTDRSHANGHESRCKVCKALYMSEYLKRPEIKQREELKRKRDIRYIEKRRARQKKYKLEQRYKYKYRGTSKCNVERRKLRVKERREFDPKIKLQDSMRARMRHDLKRGKAGITSHAILNNILHYDIEKLKAHLEKQFLPDMSWDNYGINGWHIDHIIPVSVFNFKSPNDIDFKKCWALKNLRPMWAKDNCSKGSRLSKPFQPSLAMSI
jgi:hypothetical protein